MITNVDIYRLSTDISLYEIFKSNILGYGSNSIVYLGRCIRSSNLKNIKRPDKLVAIKKISRSKLNERCVQMLETEIEILKKIMTNPHPNIIECYDVIYESDITYIITEYCDCGNFSSLLIGKQFNDLYLRHYFGQIANAIKFLRDNKIIHRDMKPSNILLMSDKKNIKLCDFGFAKQMHCLKRVTTICGSPLYMAPELFKKESYTESVDVWSLGIILFEMVYGIHPFSNYNDLETLSQSVIKNTVHVKDNEGLNKKCIDLLNLMLKKNDYERITIDDLLKHEWIINDCVLTNDELACVYNTTHVYTNLSSNINNDILNSSFDELIFEIDI